MSPQALFLLAGILLAVPSAGQPFAYITNVDSNDVSVIDLETRSVIDTVAVGMQPQGVAVNSHADRVYVTNNVSHDVSVIDTENHQVVATIPVCDQPLGIAVSHDDATIYVVCQEPGLWTLDAASLSVINTLPIDPINPLGVAVSPNGQYVYVTSREQPALLMIDAATQTVVESLDLGGVGVTVGRDGRIWLADQANDLVHVLDGTSLEILATLPVPGEPTAIALTPTGSRAFVTQFLLNRLTVIDAGLVFLALLLTTVGVLRLR